MHVLLWLLGLSPVPQGTSPWYQLYSGFLPNVLVIGAIAGGYKRLMCHQEGCWRLGTHPDGAYRKCRKHHPTHGDTPEEHAVELGGNSGEPA